MSSTQPSTLKRRVCTPADQSTYNELTALWMVNSCTPDWWTDSAFIHTAHDRVMNHHHETYFFLNLLHDLQAHISNDFWYYYLFGCYTSSELSAKTILFERSAKLGNPYAQCAYADALYATDPANLNIAVQYYTAAMNNGYYMGAVKLYSSALEFKDLSEFSDEDPISSANMEIIQRA